MGVDVDGGSFREFGGRLLISAALTFCLNPALIQAG